MPCKQGIFSADGNWPNGAFNDVVIHLDAAITQEQM